MQTVHRITDIAPAPRQYRNRPNPRTFDTPHTEPLSAVIHLIGGDPFLREQLTACQTPAETKVVGFSSANEYFDFSCDDAAACVIIESSLPDMSGLELQCRLASTSNPPVIFRPDF